MQSLERRVRTVANYVKLNKNFVVRDTKLKSINGHGAGTNRTRLLHMWVSRRLNLDEDTSDKYDAIFSA